MTRTSEIGRLKTNDDGLVYLNADKFKRVEKDLGSRDISHQFVSKNRSPLGPLQLVEGTEKQGS
jgi:hypothetical protein